MCEFLLCFPIARLLTPILVRTPLVLFTQTLKGVGGNIVILEEAAVSHRTTSPARTRAQYAFIASLFFAWVASPCLAYV